MVKMPEWRIWLRQPRRWSLRKAGSLFKTSETARPETGEGLRED